MENIPEIGGLIFKGKWPFKSPKCLSLFPLLFALFMLSSCHYQVIDTTNFRPSFRSHLARLTVKYYLAPAYSGSSTVNQTRGALRKISRLAWLPWGTKVKEVQMSGVKGELVRSSRVSNRSEKIILYLHGGGFFSGSPATHRELAARISKASGLSVLVPDYRLAPEHKYPAANEDCLKVYRWLLRNGYSPRHIVIGGDSAGGCLTLMTLLSVRDAGEPMPAAAFLLSPLTDAVQFDGESMKTRANMDPWFQPEALAKHIEHYIGDIEPVPAILSPARQNLAGLPPMLIQVGEEEILLSDSKRLAKRAREAGVVVTLEVWDHMWHVFQAFGVIMPESRLATNHIGTFIKSHIR